MSTVSARESGGDIIISTSNNDRGSDTQVNSDIVADIGGRAASENIAYSAVDALLQILRRRIPEPSRSSDVAVYPECN